MWRPMWEARPEDHDFNTGGLRRVIMAGYMRDGRVFPWVGEAYWGNPDGKNERWVWRAGGDVINPLGFQDLPDFPIAEHQTSGHVVGHSLA